MQNSSSSFCGRRETAISRRDFLMRSGAGFGALALAGMLRGTPLAAALAQNPLAARAPHFAPKAKSVIFLFMEGGPSHIDTFDPKPLLNELAGQAASRKLRQRHHRDGRVRLARSSASKRKWKQHGQSGTVGHRLAPAHRRACADDIARHPLLLGRRHQPLRPASAR